MGRHDDEKSVWISKSLHGFLKKKAKQKGKGISEYTEEKILKGISNKSYRELAEEKYGLELKDGEGVHHINMNKNDNDKSNLWVFNSKAEHGKAHNSLFKLVEVLMRLDIIGFDEWDGVYKLKEDINYNNLTFRVGKFEIKEKDFNRLTKNQKQMFYDMKKIIECGVYTFCKDYEE